MTIRVLALLALAAPLLAQESVSTTRPDTGSFGIGMTISTFAVLVEDFTMTPFGVSAILLPIRVSGKMMLEPEIGIIRVKYSSTSATGSTEYAFTNVRLGTGILAQLARRGALRPYAGPRVGIERRSTRSVSSATGTDKTTQTNWSLSGVLGAQHYFTEHFSLGGEAQLSYVKFGNQETSGFGEPVSGRTLVHTTAVAMLRWYF